MAQYTENLNLYKPSPIDSEIDIHTSLAQNFQNIDDNAGTVDVDIEALKAKTNFIINLAEYGVVGDGTDETASIRQALLDAEGGMLLIPTPQTHYGTTGDLVIPNNTTVIGTGALCKFKLLPGANKDIFRNQNRDKDSAIRDENIVIAGLHIDGDHANQQQSPVAKPYANINAIAGIRLVNVDSLVIKDVISEYNVGYGVEIKSCTDGKVDNCQFYHNGDDGISVSDGTYTASSDDIVISNCKAEYNGYAFTNSGNSGFEVDDGPDKVTLINCVSRFNNGRGYELHVHDNYNVNVGINDITYINCLAESNNADSTFTYRSNCGFSIDDIGSGVTTKNIRYINCTSKNHSNREFDIGPADDGGIAKNVQIINPTIECKARDINTTVTSLNKNAIKINGVKTLKIVGGSMYGAKGTDVINIYNAENTGITFSGVTMESFRRLGTFSLFSSGDVHSKINVTDNIFQSPTTGEGQQSAPLLFVENAHSLVAKGNNFDINIGTCDGAIGLGNTNLVDRAVINDNILNGFVGGGDTATVDPRAINLQGCPDAIVNGNFFEGFTYGIRGTAGNTVAVGNSSPDATTMLELSGTGNVTGLNRGA